MTDTSTPDTTAPLRPTPYRVDEDRSIDINDPATQNWLAARYPAIANPKPVGMSEDYQFMDPRKLINAATQAGLQLVAVNQQWSRQRDPRGQEHMLRFRFPATGPNALVDVGDTVPELVIMNSHNGRSRIKAYAGLFRMVCANGMVVADMDLGAAAMRHFGQHNTLAAFLELMGTMTRKLDLLRARVEAMQATMLSPHHQNQLARAMLELRGAPSWMEPAMVLEAQRPADEREEDGQRSLWVTFNVLQENLTNARITPPEGVRGRPIRPVRGALRDVMLNEKLWQLLDSFARMWLDPELFKSSEEPAEGAVEQPAEDAVEVPEEPVEEPTANETSAERKRRKARERYHARKQNA